MIKKRKILKRYFGRALKGVGLACLTCSIFVAGCQVAKPKLDLPKQKDAEKRLLEIYGDQDSMYLNNSIGFCRLPYKENDTIKVNLTFQPTETQNLVFEDSLAEFNDIFYVINPKYKFELNYSPTEQDLLDPYNIDVEIIESLGNSDSYIVAGDATSTLKKYDKSTGGGIIFNNIIRLPQSTTTNPATLMTVFKHEFFHTLGIGDAYLNPNATTNTIMQSVSARTSLSNYDAAFIDALYRSPNNSHTEEEINDYIRNYETTNTHTWPHILSNLIYENLAQIDIEDFKKSIYLYHSGKEDITAWKDKLTSLQNIDRSFGLSDCCFAALKQDAFSYFPHPLSYMQITNNSCQENYYSPYYQEGIKSYTFTTTAANGMIFIGLLNDFYFKVDDVVLHGTYNRTSFEITSIDHQILFKETNLTSEEYFDAVLSEEKSSTKTTKTNIFKNNAEKVLS